MFNLLTPGILREIARVLRTGRGGYVCNIAEFPRYGITNWGVALRREVQQFLDLHGIRKDGLWCFDNYAAYARVDWPNVCRRKADWLEAQADAWEARSAALAAESPLESADAKPVALVARIAPAFAASLPDDEVGD